MKRLPGIMPPIWGAFGSIIMFEKPRRRERKVTDLQKYVSLLEGFNIAYDLLKYPDKTFVQIRLEDGTGPSLSFRTADGSYKTVGMPVNIWEKRLFIVLDGIEGYIFDRHWEMTDQERAIVLKGYEDWNNAFHLIWRNWITNVIGRVDLVPIDPLDWAKLIGPGEYIVNCTVDDFAIKAGLRRKEDHYNTYIKD